MRVRRGAVGARKMREKKRKKKRKKRRKKKKKFKTAGPFPPLPLPHQATPPLPLEKKTQNTHQSSRSLASRSASTRSRCRASSAWRRRTGRSSGSWLEVGFSVFFPRRRRGATRERAPREKEKRNPPSRAPRKTDTPPRASQPADAATPSHYSFVFIRFSPLQELAFFLFCFLVKSSPFCLQFPRLSPTPPLSLSPHSKHPTASASLARDPAGPCARRRAPCRSLWKRGSSPRRPQRRRRRRGRPQARKRWRSSSSLLLFLFLLLLLLLLTTTLALLCRLLARARRGRPGRVSRKNEGKEVEGKAAW